MKGTVDPFGPFMERWTWDDGQVMFVFHCPGCESTHAYWTQGGTNHQGPIWSFDGSADAPTFSPSLLNRTPDGNGGYSKTCHLFVRSGQIEYCSDSTHALAGQTVPMQPFQQVCREKTS